MFLGRLLDQTPQAAQNNILHLSNALNEDVETLKSVLMPPIQLPGGYQNFYTTKRDHGSVRYCEDCAAVGYHSYLHELEWLAQCPFHNCDLKVQHPTKYSSNKQIKKCETLAAIMQTKCKEWPRATRSVVAGEFPRFLWLSKWLPRVTAISEEFSQKIIWKSYEQPLPETRTPEQVLGRLHSFAPIPPQMKSMFSNIEEGWKAEVVNFPKEARAEFARITSTGINNLYVLFKRISAYSDKQFRFVTEMRTRLGALASSHPNCQCVWGSEETRYGQRWIRVHPDEWPHWNMMCPYDFVAREVHMAVGERFERLSYRRREVEQTSLIEQSRELKARCLVEFTANAQVSPEGHLYMFPQNWPPLSWVGTPWVNQIFDTAALFEFRAIYDSYITLLEEIRIGENPGNYDAPPVLLWLSETKKGLVLIRWHKPDSPRLDCALRVQLGPS